MRNYDENEELENYPERDMISRFGKLSAIEFLNSLVFLSDDELKELGVFEFLDLLKTCNIIPKDLRVCWRYTGAGSRDKNKTLWYFVDGYYNTWGYGYGGMNAFASFVATLVSTRKLPKVKSYNELIMKLKLGWRK